MNEDKVYVGSGKVVGKYGKIAIQVNIDEAENYIREYNGKRYLNLNIEERKNKTEKATHSVVVDTWKPKPKEQGDEIPM